jgi:hypothetical protein
VLPIKKNEKDGTCNIHEGHNRGITGLIEESERKGLLGRVTVDNRIILKWILKIH